MLYLYLWPVGPSATLKFPSGKISYLYFNANIFVYSWQLFSYCAFKTGSFQGDDLTGERKNIFDWNLVRIYLIKLTIDHSHETWNLNITEHHCWNVMNFKTLLFLLYICNGKELFVNLVNPLSQDSHLQ